ncbi:MAG: M48 family metalloprotease [Patescibacteria group bacterium]|jgi:heat shock protein HtpX
MYSEIDSNKRKTVVLILLFTIIIVAIGWTIGEMYGAPDAGIILAVLVAVVMNLFGYFQGDAVALASSGAKPIEKAQNPELYNLIENLSITAGLPTPKIYIIEDPSPNAFACGRDPNHSSIAVTTGLLKMLNRPELEGVLAHEMSHIGNYDIRIMTLVVILVGTIMLLSDIMLRSMRFKGNRDSQQIQLILVLLGLLLAILSPLLAQLIKLAVSRSREYLADASGALLTRYPEGLASALEKIAAYDRPMAKANHATAHLFLANPFDPKIERKFELWFSSHPPIEERIKKLRNMIQ